MLKSVFFAFTLVVIAAVHAKPEPPAAEVHTHHYHTHTTTVKQHHPQKQQKHGKQPRDRSQQEQPHWQQYNQGEQQQQQQVKIRQSGPSKIFGWLGSRFAKIPHYLPRFPQFPKNPSSQKQQHQNQQHQQPSYHAIILPDPPKPAGHGKVKSPQKVKLTQVTEVYEQPQVSPYLEVAANSAVQHNTYAPLPVSVTSYTVPNTAQQIEVVPSTLLYSDKQVFHPQQQQQQQYQSSNPIAQYKQIAPAPAPIAAPPLQYTQYSVPQVSYNAIPTPVQKPQVFAAQGYKQPQAGTVPVVPQSTGPDYFDTAYRGATEQQVGYQIVSAKQQEQQQQQQQQQQQVLLSPENNYGATYEIQSQSVPQVYDSSVNLGAIGGPVISSTSQQASYSSAPAQTYTSIQQYANQALSSQQLSALSSSIADSAAVNQEQNIYAQYSQLAPSVAQAPVQGQDASQQGQSAGGQQQYVYQYQTQDAAESQNQPQLSDTPGVQILSQSTDGGNPVFEVIADANAPDYNGHPFDINKLISMIEPGAQLESAELSHAASETKTTYMAPASGSTSSSSSSATSGINDLLISESAPAPSVVANVNGSKLSHAPSSSSSSLPLNLNGNSKLNNSSSSSYKEIMDFFQQTGGKGYILVEKKRQRDPHSDNLTLDSDANRDDDLTNEGPTRLNITSDSFFLPQLNLLEQGGRPLTNKSVAKSESSNNIPTDLLFPLDSPDFEENSEIDEYDTSINNGQTNVNNESVQKHINSFNVNHIPSHSDKRQNSNSKTAQIQTTAPSVSTGSNVAVAESSINNSTTTDRPSTVDHPVTQVTQLTTLFEPVTPGKPVIFATTPSTTLNGSTFHPHHNYYAHTSPRPSPQYPSFIPLPQRGGSAPTLNSFLDSIDESLLLGEDDPIETEGDLNASESQQVRSIAITVTPPPSLVSTTPAGKPSKHKSTLTVTTARTTTTEKPVSPITINPAFLVPVTKKATADGSKRRPAPVYMGNKKTTQAPVAAV